MSKYIIVEDESITKYFKEIKKSSKLTSEEEIELSKKIQNGDQQAFNKLINANLKFVIKIAKDYQGQGLSLNDLISEGNEGLIKAAKRFDGSLGNRFISYAVWWIRQSIRESLNNNSRTIRLPTNIVGKIHSTKKDVNQFILKNGREPQYGEEFINNKGNVVVEDYVIPSCDSYNCSLKNSDNFYENELVNLIPCDNSTIYEGEDVKEEMIKKEINNILSILSDRERNIIELYFGIGKNHDGVTLEVIGDIYNLTKERVRQIKDKGIKKLRHNVHRLASLINE